MENKDYSQDEEENYNVKNTTINYFYLICYDFTYILNVYNNYIFRIMVL